jgi:hypothetical protein
MSAKLGFKPRKMINDGGISLFATHKLKIPPVLSMEVIRFRLLISGKTQETQKTFFNERALSPCSSNLR